MALIQALRRSIKGDKEKQHHTSIGNKSAVAIIPPKKVIRALYDYEAQSSQEMSFSKGDFFHVIGRENDQDWYEACNPALPDARGLVPVAFFQALGRTERDSAQSDNGRPPTAKSPDHDSGYSENAPHPITTAVPITHRSTKSTDIDNKIFAIVMYDFEAQRADELGAHKGEQIIIIAQSTPEWFVAKPIARLGGPGLIPVSYVEIRYVKTREVVPNALEAVRRAGVPSVEEWKKMAANYKNSSITLGKFEAGGPPGGQQQAVEQGMERMSLQAGRQSTQNGSQHRAQQQSMPQSQQFAPNQSTPLLYAPERAWIPRYCFAEDKYWFVIVAVLEDKRHWELSRYYEDFYDFQIALLTEFPAEAGNAGSAQKRTLPYMPGPVSYVTDAITEGRLHNLDAYVKNLLSQPEYISRCNLVKQFFAPREGDYEVDPHEIEEQYRLSQASQQSAEPPGNSGSRTNLNGNGYSGLSATPRQMDDAQPGTGGQPQGQQQQQALMKVKMYYNGDLIAIRVPSEVEYQQLCDKIRDRLKLSPDDQLQLFYRDEPTGNKPNLMSNNDLDFALQRNEKLVLYVEVV
ncbi:protein kinase activator Bem1 [Pochonia chlamydosporia 170]|uniref:Protein kinase activator Bem1 n=1 Tax=Pochonia chlamydosporia 170 TaxID=1380566 RepID=A0A179FUE0_METCM|nr:protein kinase activator Bem1 [Pochonia chlamydosporia 170]OAQ68848.1 protein kinase activator Bem1 [Pochonia chlamydosporia 170]